MDINKFLPEKGKGGTRKIADFPEEKICRCPEHDPATMIVRSPGIYEHTCPSCGVTQTFIVNPKPTMSVSSGSLGLWGKPLDPTKGNYLYNPLSREGLSAKYALTSIR